MPGFRAANKLLNKYEQERNYRIHKQKMANARTTINNKSPKKYPHLIVKLKQIQLEEERQAEVDHENKLLLHKMTNIMKNRPSLDYWNEYEPKSLNFVARERQLRDIQMENIGIARRLEHAKPVYDLDEFDTDYQHKKYLQMLWNENIKDYVSVTPRHLKYREMRKYMGQDSEYEDYDSIDADSGHMILKSDKLPPLGDSRSKQDIKLPPKGEGKSVKSEYQYDKLPKIDKQKRKVKKYTGNAINESLVLNRGKGKNKLKVKIKKFEKIEEEKETLINCDKNNNKLVLPEFQEKSENVSDGKQYNESKKVASSAAIRETTHAQHDVTKAEHAHKSSHESMNVTQNDKRSTSNNLKNRSDLKFVRLNQISKKNISDNNAHPQTSNNDKNKGDNTEMESFYDAEKNKKEKHVNYSNELLLKSEDSKSKNYTEELLTLNSDHSISDQIDTEINRNEYHKENGVIVHDRNSLKVTDETNYTDSNHTSQSKPVLETNYTDSNHTSQSKPVLEIINDNDNDPAKIFDDTNKTESSHNIEMSNKDQEKVITSEIKTENKRQERNSFDVLLKNMEETVEKSKDDTDSIDKGDNFVQIPFTKKGYPDSDNDNEMTDLLDGNSNCNSVKKIGELNDDDDDDRDHDSVNTFENVRATDFVGRDTAGSTKHMVEDAVKQGPEKIVHMNNTNEDTSIAQNTGKSIEVNNSESKNKYCEFTDSAFETDSKNHTEPSKNTRDVNHNSVEKNRSVDNNIKEYPEKDSDMDHKLPDITEKKHKSSKQRTEEKKQNKKVENGKISSSMVGIDTRQHVFQSVEDDKTEKGRNVTRQKTEDGSEDGESRRDRPRDTQLDQDCVALFKAAKQLAKPEEVFTKHLVRRPQKHRLQIKTRFSQLYDLNLIEELKNGLGKDWYLVIDGLLSDRTSSNAVLLHHAIQKKDYSTIVEVLYFCDNNSLSDLNNSYKKEYAVSIEGDIQENIEEPERNLFVILQRNNKDESTSTDEKEAERDADDLHESGDGRWHNDSGKFLKLLGTKSYSYIKVVLSIYRVLGAGQEVTDEIKQECPKKYAEALCTLINCMRSPENHYADKLYKHLMATDPVLVNLLISRSEIDMPAIKRAYKKRYDADLVEDFRYRNDHPTVNVLVELTNRPVQSKGKLLQQKRFAGAVAHSPVKRQVVKRPDNKTKSVDTDSIHHNPLAQPSQRVKADATHEKKEQEKQKEKEKQDKTEQKTQKKNVSGTVRPVVNFDPDNDCERLRKAMSGLGTDENVIIEIIPHRSNGQRQQLKKKYQEKYKKDLSSELESELSGDCEEVVLALMMTPVEYDAYCLHEAIDGLGTTESTLIGILCTRDAKEKKAILEHYKKVYKSDLEKDIISDTSGDFQNMLVALIKGERDQSSNVNQKEAQQDAKRLYKDGQITIDVKDETFIDILVKKNHAQVKATFKEYEKLTGCDIYKGISNAMLGDAEDGYVALAKAIQDPVEFYADRLKSCFGGLGTNDNMLIRICVSRSEIDLGDILTCYEKLCNKTLAQSIQKECSGDYKRLLLAVIGEDEQ